ncbi:hypothetical protein NPIL_276521 [Nephila pilipes]|uniref:Uncharacterized protein n=1 Tax=Nephila pilipes TaxID=299642 RepID=A0A8X6R264_NEPPI|nr:hypothetical protein NPIL_276521 [Nephila pilipes]
MTNRECNLSLLDITAHVSIGIHRCQWGQNRKDHLGWFCCMTNVRMDDAQASALHSLSIQNSIIATSLDPAADGFVYSVVLKKIIHRKKSILLSK